MARPHDLKEDLYPTPLVLARRRATGPIVRYWDWLSYDTSLHRHSAWFGIAMFLFGGVLLGIALLGLTATLAGLIYLYQHDSLGWVFLGLALTIVGGSLLRKIIEE